VKKIVLRLAAAAAGGLLGAAACGDASESGFDEMRNDGGAPDGSFFDGGAIPPAGDAAPIIEANGVVLVHAASFPAFRICFENGSNELPEPSTDLLPDSNVVGVDVGTAVRLDPPKQILGHAFAFPEAKLRSLYPIFGVGPTCGQLLNGMITKTFAVEVGSVMDDISHGVHALVLGGCLPAVQDPNASTARCGPTWDATAGNLKLKTISLTAYARSNDTRLSVQLVQLSPALASRAQGRALGLAFGSLEAGAPTPFVEGPAPFATPFPTPPATLDYAATDISSYATTGVFMTLGGALDDGGAPLEAGVDGGPREVIVMQSLADIQKGSSRRSLPPDWYSVASSYVVLSVGDPDPRLDDGGADTDPRRMLHLLALPLAAPDGGTGGGATGGDASR
jgi:hypothetical protein